MQSKALFKYNVSDLEKAIERLTTREGLCHMLGQALFLVLSYRGLIKQYRARKNLAPSTDASHTLDLLMGLNWGRKGS